ncbi:MAG: hypothetical protein V2J24_04455 [Pseudomonadales bacterium]|jgi:hypothetical protein|nr:hypothetical protein [Pseudomonadales bacterium]
MAGGKGAGGGNPLADLQQLITDWERRIDSVANRVMGTDEFSRGLNTVQSVQLGMQRAFLEAMATHLNNFNMPSRDDVIEIGETLRTLDRRVAHIEQLLEAQSGDAGRDARVRRGPPRTKRPPSARGEAK